MSIVPSHIAVDLKFPLFKGPYSHIPVDLGAKVTPPEDCDEMWKEKPHSAIDLNLNVERVDVAFNAVDFNFACVEVPVECPDEWKDKPGNALVDSFSLAWTHQKGDELYENWYCGQKPPIFFEGYIKSFDGEEATFRLDNDIIVKIEDGEEMVVDLNDRPAAILFPRFYDGEQVEKIPLDFPIIAKFYDGEATTLDLKDHPAALLSPRAYDGEEIPKFGLYVPDRYIIFDGEELEVDLTESPAPSMEVMFEDGEQVEDIVLRMEYSLQGVKVFDGEQIPEFELNDTGLYKVFDGEEAKAELNTDFIIAVDYEDGERFVDLDLHTRPSEGVGRLSGFDGERADLKVSTLRSVDLYPMVIAGDGSEMDVNATNRRFFELGTSCCLPCNAVDSADVNIGLDFWTDENIIAEAIGDCTRMTVDLQALPRFQIAITDGETFVGADPNYIGSLNFTDGENNYIHTVASVDYNFALCPGNLIPDGDNVYIELVTEYNANCYADMFFDGESMTTELAQELRPVIDWYDSEYMRFDLFVDPIMRLFAYDGEHARVSNPEFTIRYHDGEQADFSFYEANYEAADGEEMTFDIQTRYYVEFLENGCLDNEYMPMNENGDADVERFRPVPVELDFFAHVIKARCF